jgi:hypothetical protein
MRLTQRWTGSNRVYLDVNIYRQLETGGWLPVRAALRKAGYRVVVGDPVVGEAIGIPDAANRQRQIRCVCGVRDEWTDRVPGEEMVTESYRLLRRIQPAWVTGDSHRALASGIRKRRRAALRNLSENAAQQELWNRTVGPLIRENAEELRKWQQDGVQAMRGKTYREALAERIPAGIDLPATMPDSELQWRLLAAERFSDASNGRRVEQVNYLVDLRAGVDPADWCLFWLDTRFSATDVPATAMHGLVRFYQLHQSLKGTGNLVDAMHATAALGCASFVTSDALLAEVLTDVRSDLRGIAPRPVFFPYGTITPDGLVLALQDR